MRLSLLLSVLLCLAIGCKTTEPGVPAPSFEVHSFFPQQSAIGDTLRIQGSGFGVNPSKVFVTFDEQEARLVTLTNTEITCIVPDNVASSPKVKVFIGNTSEDLPGFFFISNQNFHISPTEGKTGTLITAKLQTSFRDITGAKLGSKYMKVVEQTTNKVVLAVPPDGESGRITILEGGSEIGLSAEKFIFIPTQTERRISGFAVSIKGVSGTQFHTERRFDFRGQQSDTTYTLPFKNLSHEFKGNKLSPCDTIESPTHHFCAQTQNDQQADVEVVLDIDTINKVINSLTIHKSFESDPSNSSIAIKNAAYTETGDSIKVTILKDQFTSAVESLNWGSSGVNSVAFSDAYSVEELNTTGKIEIVIIK